jgi:hypothetical protein
LKTPLLLCVVALVLLTSCAKDPNAVIASYDHEKFLRDKVQYEPKIGKDYWVQRPVFLCAKPARDPDGECGLLAVTTKLEQTGSKKAPSATLISTSGWPMAERDISKLLIL